MSLMFLDLQRRLASARRVFVPAIAVMARLTPDSTAAGMLLTMAWTVPTQGAATLRVT